jgi:trimeric autotransporter adhesin
MNIRRGLSAFARPLRRMRHEDGAVIVIVAVLLTCFMGAGALAIDLGSARQSQTQAQSAADAAALAVSDAASSGTTSIATLQSVGQQMADANDPGQTVQVTLASPGAYRVSVTGDSHGPLAAGIVSKDPRVAASAIAAVEQTVSTGVSTSLSSTTFTSTVTATATSTSTTVSSTWAPCAALASSGCLAIYAADPSCGVDGYTSNSGSNQVNGGIITDGSGHSGGGSNAFNGPVYYATGCSWTTTGGSDAYNDGAATARAQATGWPIDYSKDFPSCSGTCTGPGGTPKFCTVSSTSTSWTVSPSARNIYCAVGSGTASNPSTWNGAITLGNGASDVSFVGGSVTTQGGGITLSPCGSTGPLSAYSAGSCASGVPAPATASYPLFSMNGAGTAINMGGGACSFNGDSFAPNGTIALSAGSNVAYFMEAQSVSLAAGSDVVDSTGPSPNPVNSTSTSTSTSLSTSLSTSVSTSTSTTTTTTAATKTGASDLTG